MVNDEDAPPGARGSLACEKEPVNMPLGVVIDGLVKVMHSSFTHHGNLLYDFM